MTNKWIKLSGVALMSLYLAACDTDEEVVEDDSTEVIEEEETDLADEESVEEDIEEADEGEMDSEEAEADSDLDETLEDADSEETESMYAIDIEGMDNHYHTGALVELTAILEEDTGYDDWQWYIRDNEESEWEMMPDYDSNELVIAAPQDTVELRAVLYDDNHEMYAESAPIELEVDNH